jgi:hypothetical protein
LILGTQFGSVSQCLQSASTGATANFPDKLRATATVGPVFHLKTANDAILTATLGEPVAESSSSRSPVGSAVTSAASVSGAEAV